MQKQTKAAKKPEATKPKAKAISKSPSHFAPVMGKTLSLRRQIAHEIGRSMKKTKDKDAPKRAMSAFFCYQKSRREPLQKESPKLDNKQLVSVSLSL